MSAKIYPELLQSLSRGFLPVNSASDYCLDETYLYCSMRKLGKMRKREAVGNAKCEIRI